MAYPETWPPTVDQIMEVVENTSSGDPDVAAEAQAELQYMAETSLGMSLEAAFPDEWASVKATGVPVDIDVSIAGVPVTLTLDRESYTVSVSSTPNQSPIIPGPRDVHLAVILEGPDGSVSELDPFRLYLLDTTNSPNGWRSAGTKYSITQLGFIRIHIDPLQIKRYASGEGAPTAGWWMHLTGTTDTTPLEGFLTDYSSSDPSAIVTDAGYLSGGMWGSPIAGMYFRYLNRTTSTWSDPIVTPTTTYPFQTSAGFHGLPHPGTATYSEASHADAMELQRFYAPGGWDWSTPDHYGDTYERWINVGTAAANRRIGYAFMAADQRVIYHSVVDDHPRGYPTFAGPGDGPQVIACHENLTDHPDDPYINVTDSYPQLFSSEFARIEKSGYIAWEPVTTGGIAYFATVGPSTVPDGKPPDTTPNTPKPPATGTNVPVPPPVSGGCRASMDGPSSCDFNVPLPEPNFEEPELNPDFPLPGDFPINDDFPMPEMPIFNANYPEFPEFCLPPDFGQMTDCKPQPGTNHVPGGRDRRGRRGKQMAHIKQGGITYGIRDDTFNQWIPTDPVTGEQPEDPDTGEPIIPPQRCWPENSSIMTAITTILLDLGVSPLDIVWEIGAEWDKTFGPHCFPETTAMFDAAVWLAQKLMLRIIDEGEPSYKVYIGPPTHRPASQTFTFQDTYYPGISTNPPFANLAHGYSSSEAYYAVKVWGSHLSPSAWAIVDTPFAKDPTNILEIQVGPNYSFAEAQELALFRAALIRRAAVSVQVTVPYSENYYMRDTMVLQVPSAGYQETFTIFAKQSEVSVESKAHILTGVLPATLAELDQFPEVLEEPVELGAAFLDWPKMRSATKRKGERRLERHLRRRERRLELAS